MTRERLSFGGLQSTSNVLASDAVVIESNIPVIWTTELNHKALAAALEEAGGEGAHQQEGTWAPEPHRRDAGVDSSCGGSVGTGPCVGSFGSVGIGGNLGARPSRRLQPSRLSGTGSGAASQGGGTEGSDRSVVLPGLSADDPAAAARSQEPRRPAPPARVSSKTGSGGLGQAVGGTALAAAVQARAGGGAPASLRGGAPRAAGGAEDRGGNDEKQNFHFF